VIGTNRNFQGHSIGRVKSNCQARLLWTAGPRAVRKKLRRTAADFRPVPMPSGAVILYRG
jgi:hypothetical protein